MARKWQYVRDVPSTAAFLTPGLFGFLMVLFRCTALCMVAPIFSARAVPMRVRMGIAVILTFAVWSGAGFPMFLAFGSVSALVERALVETVIGLGGGLAAQLVVDGLTAAGALIASAMGLSYGAILDPLHGSESTAIAEILSMAALGAMVALGLHREAVVWLCRSVVALPPSGDATLAPVITGVVTQSIGAIAFGVRLAFPIMAAVTFGHLALGIMGRGNEQINIGSVGFSVTILAGGAALYMMAPAIAEIAARTAVAAFSGGRP